MKKNSALTIIEILIVVSLVGVLSIPLYISYTRTQANQGLRASSERLVNSLRNAHIFSRETKDEKAWGVKSNGDKHFQLVKGTSASFRVESNISLEPLVSLDEEFEIWFEAGSGELTADKTLTVINDYGNQQKIIIHKTGVVELLSP